MGILLTCFITEVISSILTALHVSTGLFVSCSIIIHDFLWLLLLKQYITKPKIARIGIILFVCFSIVNLYNLQSASDFNYYSFVLGAFIYISIFLGENFQRLKKEDIAFFISDDYLLMAAPVLFFMDISLMFGFDSYDLPAFQVFEGIKLYDVLIYFVNISYYLLINIYIYRKQKAL